MKSLILGLILSTSVFCNTSFAQNSDSQKKVNIHTNPFTLFVGAISFGADFAVNQNLTLGGNMILMDYTFENDSSEDINAEAKGFGFRVQYFFTEALNDGWYISGFGDFGKGEVENRDTGDFADLKTTAMGATAGYFWRWGTFNLQLGLGLQNTNIELTDDNLSASDREEVEDLEGLGLTGDLRIGLAF